MATRLMGASGRWRSAAFVQNQGWHENFIQGFRYKSVAHCVTKMNAIGQSIHDFERVARNPLLDQVDVKELSQNTYNNHANHISKHNTESLEDERFKCMLDRDESTVNDKDALRNLLLASYMNNWRGVPFMKSALCMSMYPVLIQDLRPRTIIETGSYKGGGAMWYADTAHTLLGSHFQKVLAFDISLANVAAEAFANPWIEFFEVGSADIGNTLRPRLNSLPRPILFIEDAHFEFDPLLKFLHEELLQPGDYLSVEDTNPLLKELWDEAEFGFSSFENIVCDAKRAKLRDLCIEEQDKYRVDTKYTDMFGHNAGKFCNSIIKRIA